MVVCWLSSAASVEPSCCTAPHYDASVGECCEPACSLLVSQYRWMEDQQEDRQVLQDFAAGKDALQPEALSAKQVKCQGSAAAAAACVLFFQQSNREHLCASIYFFADCILASLSTLRSNTVLSSDCPDVLTLLCNAGMLVGMSLYLGSIANANSAISVSSSADVWL